jgi:hypothetical protein
LNREKLFHKYLQDKTMHYNQFRRLILKNSKLKKLTDYEKGYIAGVCHGLKEVNRDLTQDNDNIENIINYKIGTGLKWCRRK